MPARVSVHVYPITVFLLVSKSRPTTSVSKFVKLCLCVSVAASPSV